MKSVLILLLFVISCLGNAVLASAHTDENHNGHQSHDAAHIHIETEHEHHDESQADHEHGDIHVHLCLHMLPLENNLPHVVPSRQQQPQHWLASYFSLAHRPPVPPPTV